jgi:molybdopterin-guanine dinucleotide biosynthesis protein A
MAVTGFILAGGKSTRMGRDKAVLDWNGRTLLDHMVDLLCGITEQVRVVGRDPLPDRLPGLGPLSGIATALEVTSTDANLIIAVDLPHLTKEFLKYLRSRLENSSYPLVACKIGSAFPLCLGIWRPMLPEIHRRLSTRQFSVRGLIESGNSAIIPESELQKSGFDANLFRNINTPEDYTNAFGG